MLIGFDNRFSLTCNTTERADVAILGKITSFREKEFMRARKSDLQGRGWGEDDGLGKTERRTRLDSWCHDAI